MKKFTALVFFALFFAGFSHAQTMRIAHRSHSAADATIRYNGEGNFGLTPEVLLEMKRRQAQLDSIRVADSLKALIPLKDTVRIDSGKLKKQLAPQMKDKEKGKTVNGVPDWIIHPERMASR
jgi:hypothetical protein